MSKFTTHTGEIVTGERLQKALKAVADDWEKLGRDIYAEDCYASHVSEDTKLKNLQDHIDRAEEIRQGIVESFTIWQRVNTKLTGECVALLR